MQLIHHYTNIDTLALILQNKTLRFNRLDRVDDVSECQECSGIKFGQYYFVSSWTKLKEESIPQWHMYTNEMSGVRISFPKYPFKRERLIPPKEWNMIQEGEILSPVPFDKIFNNEFVIPPLFFNDDQFCGDIEYVKNIEEEYKKAVVHSKTPDGKDQLKISNIGRLARLKKLDWKFQDEYRFVLFILPGIDIPHDGIGNERYITELPNHMMNCLFNGVPPTITHFDVEIDQEAIDNMTVTIGPLCGAGNRIIAETLVAKFSKFGKVLPSELTGTIRKPVK
ncbi:MAG: DUF2971 domain-containing protein [Candidatus Kuenenia sp.]|nr:DUF2971 domain-containing protein [Candidatus Kuenenia hertensis]